MARISIPQRPRMAARLRRRPRVAGRRVVGRGRVGRVAGPRPPARTATFVRTLPQIRPRGGNQLVQIERNQRLYRLSRPIRVPGRRSLTNFVVSSSIVDRQGRTRETLVFAADERGKFLNFRQIGGIGNAMDHEGAMRDAKITIAPARTEGSGGTNPSQKAYRNSARYSERHGLAA